jgi:hypothetical protein
METVFKFLSDALKAIGSVINHMDATQWGIFAAIMVAVGFAALRSRL